MPTRPFILHTESEMRAGQMTCFTFGELKLWIYYEATKDGPRFAVELWDGNTRKGKTYYVTYAEATHAFSTTKIEHAVAIAMEAFDIPRNKLH